MKFEKHSEQIWETSYWTKISSHCGMIQFNISIQQTVNQLRAYMSFYTTVEFIYPQKQLALFSYRTIPVCCKGFRRRWTWPILFFANLWKATTSCNVTNETCHYADRKTTHIACLEVTKLCSSGMSCDGIITEHCARCVQSIAHHVPRFCFPVFIAIIINREYFLLKRTVDASVHLRKWVRVVDHEHV